MKMQRKRVNRFLRGGLSDLNKRKTAMPKDQSPAHKREILITMAATVKK